MLLVYDFRSLEVFRDLLRFGDGYYVGLAGACFHCSRHYYISNSSEQLESKAYQQ